MGMARAYARVPKMAISHIRIPTPLGIGACHEQEPTRDKPESLATFAHFYLLQHAWDTVLRG